MVSPVSELVFGDKRKDFDVIFLNIIHLPILKHYSLQIANTVMINDVKRRHFWSNAQKVEPTTKCIQHTFFIKCPFHLIFYMFLYSFYLKEMNDIIDLQFVPELSILRFPFKTCINFCVK